PPTSPTAARPIPATTPDVEIIEAEIVYAPPTQPWQSAPAASAPVHPLDKPEPEPLLADAGPAPAPGRAKRALADVLSGFMQERNIRWGELVSGLLIVGSAAGLILSLRDQLSLWIPYFPAFLFLLGTAAIHSAGLYTLRRWNLQ